MEAQLQHVKHLASTVTLCDEVDACDNLFDLFTKYNLLQNEIHAMYSLGLDELATDVENYKIQYSNELLDLSADAAKTLVKNTPVGTSSEATLFGDPDMDVVSIKNTLQKKLLRTRNSEKVNFF